MKTFVGRPTQISPNQMRLRALFSVERILNARGFQIKTEGAASQTILEKEDWTWQDLELIFQIFEDLQMRLDLLRAILDRSYIPGSQPVKTLTNMPDFRWDRQRFSTTFEWFVV